MIMHSEKKHINRLKNNKIDKSEIFFNPETDEEIILSTFGTKKINIYDSFKRETLYYLNNKEIYIEDNQNDTIMYTYIFNTNTDDDYVCKSCGYKDKLSVFSHGCPYCNTEIFIENHQQHNLKAKATQSVKENFFLSTGICLVLVIVGIYIDIIMQIVCIVYPILAFYDLLRIIIILISFSTEKSLWHDFTELKMKIDEGKIYNELKNQLKELYFDDKNEEYQDLIDFEILSFEEARADRKGKELYMILTYKIRKYYFDGIKITKTENICEAKLVRNTKVKHKENLGTYKCNNCGSPVKYSEEECSYCGTKNLSIISWKLEEISIDKK